MKIRKHPFGYHLEWGQIVVSQPEAELVKYIFQRYEEGESYQDLVKFLESQDILYEIGRCWNKNMIARILEDARYLGNEEYPAIIQQELYQKAARKRLEKQFPSRQTEVQKILRRLCGRNVTKQTEQDILELLNSLIREPEQLYQADKTDSTGSDELSKIEEELEDILSTQPINEDSAKRYTTTWSTGWYVAEGNITVAEITVSGDVNLILKDGCTLNANKGTTVSSGNSLTIYAQSEGEGMGKLVADGSGAGSGGRGAGIVESITITGGTITAEGETSGAGIGGGSGYKSTSENADASGTITITVGTITAKGGTSGAGIGGGSAYQHTSENAGAGGTITISGGTITATGGRNAPDIGGGRNAKDNGTLSSGENGSAWIEASNIKANTEGFTSGMLFTGGNSVVDVKGDIRTHLKSFKQKNSKGKNRHF